MGYNVSSFLAEALISLGVKRVYGIIGTSILDFLDTLYDYKEKLRYISTRHEQVAASMADAEARVTGLPGVVTVHAGPGLLNAMLGIAVAYRDHSPVLIVSGGVKRRLYRTDAWLEVDQQALLKPITKATARLANPDDLPRILTDLLRRSLEPPRGPALLEVPEDIWNQPVQGDPSQISLSRVRHKAVIPQSGDVEKVVNTLLAAEQPLILACGEAVCPGIQEVLEELMERIGAYTVVTGNGRGVCNEYSDRCLGRVGFGGGSLPADKAL